MKLDTAIKKAEKLVEQMDEMEETIFGLKSYKIESDDRALEIEMWENRFQSHLKRIEQLLQNLDFESAMNLYETVNIYEATGMRFDELFYTYTK